MVISTNECFLTHKMGSKKNYATSVLRRGIKANSTASRDWEEHDVAVR